MKLVSFDFDGTLFFTPEPNQGKIIYKNVTSLDWPYQGWWGRAESLNLDIFPIPVNPYVYRDYLNYMSDDDAYVILATGRLVKLRREVDKVLMSHNLSFDEVHLNPGGETFKFKAKLYEDLIRKVKPDVFIMYDDRHDHLSEFGHWAKLQKCQVNIIDVVNKREKQFNK